MGSARTHDERETLSSNKYPGSAIICFKEIALVKAHVYARLAKVICLYIAGVRICASPIAIIDGSRIPKRLPEARGDIPLHSNHIEAILIYRLLQGFKDVYLP